MLLELLFRTFVSENLARTLASVLRTIPVSWDIVKVHTQIHHKNTRSRHLEDDDSHCTESKSTAKRQNILVMPTHSNKRQIKSVWMLKRNKCSGSEAASGNQRNGY